MTVSELDYVDLPFQFRVFVHCKLQLATGVQIVDRGGQMMGTELNRKRGEWGESEETPVNILNILIGLL